MTEAREHDFAERSRLSGKLTKDSKAKNWAKGDAQVVMPTVVEVDLVAELKPQADRTQTRFHASSWINSEILAGTPNAEHCAHNIADGQ